MSDLIKVKIEYKDGTVREEEGDALHIRRGIRYIHKGQRPTKITLFGGFKPELYEYLQKPLQYCIDPHSNEEVRWEKQ